MDNLTWLGPGQSAVIVRTVIRFPSGPLGSWLILVVVTPSTLSCVFAVIQNSESGLRSVFGLTNSVHEFCFPWVYRERSVQRPPVSKVMVYVRTVSEFHPSVGINEELSITGRICYVFTEQRRYVKMERKRNCYIKCDFEYENKRYS